MPAFKITDCTVVIPAKDERNTIAEVVRACIGQGVSRVIVVNDGSSDDTGEVARQAGADVISHPYAVGNGGAIKTGCRASRTPLTAFLDADGQHCPGELPEMVSRINLGYGMVIGARDGAGQASRVRQFGNWLYNRLASWVVGHSIEDLTSGYRMVRSDLFLQFVPLLPNGFSYPTTSTMAFYRSGYRVAYMPITARQRAGAKSHIRVLRDGAKFLLIIFRITALYSPLKVFAPASATFFLLGLLYYAHTFFSDGRFTNFGAVLFISAVVIFLIGLISEQITSLIYMTTRDTDSDD